MVHSALNGCDIVAVGQYKDWQDPKVKHWVKCARGKISFQPRLTEQTTHLVVAEKQWKDQTAIVQDAIKRNEQGQKIHILSHEWLDESLQSKAKRAESTHSWVKKASAAMKTKVVGQPRSTAGLMSQVFADSTNAFLSDAAKSKMAKRVQLEREEREEEEKRTQETFKKQRESDNLKTLATIFTRAFHKGRQQLLADTYHICVDGMGFAWNVALEPVEKTGSPQDLPSMRLQIYESKSEPYTYAFSATANQTEKRPESNRIVCIGSNFLTMARQFKNVFQEHTRIDWADRAHTTPVKEAKFKYVVPAADPAQKLDGEVGQRREKGQSHPAAEMNRPSQTVVFGSELADSQSPKTLKRLEAKVAQRSLDAQFDNKVLATGTADLAKRKTAEDSASEDEPPNKLRKSKQAQAGTPALH